MRLKGMALLFVVCALFAEVPRLISYQGRLTDSDGTPLAGSHTITFRLYDSSSGGTPLWTEVHSVTVSPEGLYDVMLGTITPFPDSVDFSGQYWLSVSVDGGAELCRYQLGTAPYALNLASLGATDGQALVWNGTKWQPQTISTGDSDWNRVGDSLLSQPDSTVVISDGKLTVQGGWSTALEVRSRTAHINGAGQSQAQLYIKADTIGAPSWRARVLLDKVTNGRAGGVQITASNGTGNDTLDWFVGTPYRGGSSAGGFTIGASGSSPERLENSKLFISASGNVGIGTTSPRAKLQVNGDIIQKGPWVDVRAYGAYPDDGFDDAEAIQNALNEAGSSEVFIPAGTYILSSPIVVPAYTTLRGQGYFSTELLYNGPGDTAAITLGYGATVKDLKVISSRSSWNLSNPITGILVPISEAMVENVTVYNFEKGIFLLGNGRGCAYNYIQPRLMANNYYGIYLDAIDGGWVNENIIVGGRWTIWSDRATVGTWGVYITSHSGNPPNNNKFIGLSIEGYDYAIKLSGNFNTFVDPRIEVPSDLGTKARVVYQDLPSTPCKYNYFFGNYAYYTFGTSEDSFYFVHYDADSNLVPYDRNLVMMVRQNSDMPFNFLTNAIDLSGLAPWRKAYLRYNVDDDQIEVEIGGRNLMTLRHYSGRVGVATTTPGHTFQVGNYGDGTVAMANDWQTFSDSRLKKNLTVIDDPLDKIEQIHGYYFYWRDAPDQSRQVGVVAQEVEKVLPEVVSEDDNGIKSVNYGKIVPLLIEAVKSLKAQNDSLRQELLDLKHKVNNN